MISLDRTIYLCVKRSSTTKELIEAYTPTKEERHGVETGSVRTQTTFWQVSHISALLIVSKQDSKRSVGQ